MFKTAPWLPAACAFPSSLALSNTSAGSSFVSCHPLACLFFCLFCSGNLQLFAGPQTAEPHRLRSSLAQLPLVSTMPPSILLFANSQAFLKILLSVFFPPLSMPRAGPAFPFYASHCTVFTCNTLTSGYPVPLEGHSCPINVLSGWHRTGLQQTSACSSPPPNPSSYKVIRAGIGILILQLRTLNSERWSHECPAARSDSCCFQGTVAFI